MVDYCKALDDRKQLVSLYSKESSKATMDHGTPQRAILRPLMFIIFTNDLLLHVSSSVDLHANDIMVIASAGLEESLNQLLKLYTGQQSTNFL